MAKFAVGVATFDMAEPAPRHAGALGEFGLREPSATAEPSDLHAEMPDGPERSVERCGHATSLALLRYRNNLVVIRYRNGAAVLRYGNVVTVLQAPDPPIVTHIYNSPLLSERVGQAQGYGLDLTRPRWDPGRLVRRFASPRCNVL